MARSFNGTTDVITANPVSFTGTHDTARVSVSAWCLITALGGHQSIVNNGGAADGFNMEASEAGNGNRIIINLNGVGGVDFGVSMTANVWGHIVWTYNGPVAHENLCYFNGTNVLDTFSSCTFPATTTLTMGSTLGGRIADIAFWDGVLLTQAEISALAAGVRPNRIRPSSLVGYWPLFGTASPEPDLSGSRNNGTITGTTKVVGPPFQPLTPRWPQLIFPAPDPMLTQQVLFV